MGVFKRPKNPTKGRRQYWWMRYKGKEGKDVWESTHKRVGELTKHQAQAILDARKIEIQNSSADLPKLEFTLSDSPTLYEFAKIIIQRKKDRGQPSWKDDVYVFNNIIEFLGPETPITSIDAKAVDAYKAYRIKNIKPGTVDRELALLGSIFTLAIKWKIYKDHNPVTEAGLFKMGYKERRIITPKEKRLIYNASPPHFKDLLEGAFNFGMRRIELVNTDVKHVDLKNNTIHVPPYKRCNPRTLPFNPKMKKLMPRLVKESRDGALFKNGSR